MKFLAKTLLINFILVGFLYANSPLLTFKGMYNKYIFRPTRVAISKTGRIAIADYHRKQIYIFNQNNQIFSNISLPKPPLSLSFVGNDEIIAGIQGDIIRFSHDGVIVDYFSLHNSQLDFPVDIAVSNEGLIYVVEKKLSCVKVFNSNGDIQFSFGSYGIQNGELITPIGIALDLKSKEILVADAGNSRVQIFSMQGEFLRSFGEHISQVDTIWKRVGTFAHMQGIAVDASHRIYVTDSGLNHVQIFDSYGNHLGFLGNENHIIDLFRVPMGITITDDGNLFISSMGSSEVKQYKIQDITSIEHSSSDLPMEFSLEQNYPNPFNPTTQIKYAIPSEGFVNLKIYDIIGRVVRTLVYQNQKVGNYTVNWDGRDDDGEVVASGIYFYNLQVADRISKTNKMVFLK